MTDKHNNADDAVARVLAAIDERGVHMRPKMYFTLKLAAVAATSVLVLLLTVAIANFILFSIRVSGHDTLLFFGPRGLWAFFLHFPWVPLIFDIGAIALLSHLFRQFRFGYRTPIVYVLLGLAIASAAIGVFIDRGTPLNDTLYQEARENRLPPPLGGLYTGMREEWEERDGLCKCQVVAIQDGTLTVSDVRDSSSTFTVELPVDSPFATTSGIAVGDVLMIAGDVDEAGVLHAFGLHLPRRDMLGGPQKRGVPGPLAP